MQIAKIYLHERFHEKFFNKNKTFSVLDFLTLKDFQRCLEDTDVF